MGSRARRNISRDKGLRGEKKEKEREKRQSKRRKKRDAKETRNRVDRKRTEERTDEWKRLPRLDKRWRMGVVELGYRLRQGTDKTDKVRARIDNLKLMANTHSVKKGVEMIENKE